MKIVSGMVAVALATTSGMAIAKDKSNGGGSSVTIVTNSCFSVFGSQGCRYDGVVNSQSDADSLELQYNGVNDGFTNNTNIDLQLLGKIDLNGFGSSLSNKVIKDGNPNEIISAVYTNTQWVISYFGIKAGNNSVLYAVANPGSSFSWNTASLGNKGMSHISFYGSPAGAPVPEPATWAMMIGGFGLLGAAARRRSRTSPSLSAA